MLCLEIVPGPQNGRRRRIHIAMAAPRVDIFLPMKLKVIKSSPYRLYEFMLSSMYYVVGSNVDTKRQ